MQLKIGEKYFVYYQGKVIVAKLAALNDGYCKAGGHVFQKGLFNRFFNIPAYLLFHEYLNIENQYIINKFSND